MSRTLKKTTIAGALLIALTAPAGAVDGVIEINHARAVAGGVTPGDTPGYPVTIDRPGSYRLTGDLKVPGTDVDAVEVTAIHVTLDLNGFSIFCPWITTPCARRGAGIGINAVTASSLTVRNGTVRDMPDHGIAAGPQALVEDVRAESNGGIGISLVSGVLKRNIAIGNDIGLGSHNSFPTANLFMVIDCFTSGNTLGGIFSADTYVIGGNYLSDGATATSFDLIACNKIVGITSCPP